MKSIEEEEEKISALDKFIMALRSPDSKRTFPTKLEFFLDDYLYLPGSSLEEQAEAFVQKANENGVQWVLYIIYRVSENIMSS